MKKENLKLTLTVIAWISAFTFGAYQLYSFSTTPGKHAAQERWPASQSLLLTKGKPNFIIFLHPHCPCSHSSVGELKRIIDEWPGKLHVQAVFMQYGKEWAGAKIPEGFEVLASLADVKIHYDPDGRLAQQLGAQTSGAAYLVDEKGRIVFQGGLTPVRGHSGATRGQEFIRGWLAKRSSQTFIEKVFGCGL